MAFNQESSVSLTGNSVAEGGVAQAHTSPGGSRSARAMGRDDAFLPGEHCLSRGSVTGEEAALWAALPLGTLER